MRLVVFVVCVLAVFAPARADALDQGVAVTRPYGELVIEVRGNVIVVTDTRADDPGWSVSGARVAGGTATAPPRQGLGITYLETTVSGDTVTITVI